MGVDTLISDSSYGIKCMKDDTTHFNFYFRGTLVSLKGILDQILEEYNSKYKLGIPLTENLNTASFEKVAKRRKNQQALKFIQYYSTEKSKLLADARLKLLLETHGVRDNEIHRKTLPRHIKVELKDSLTISTHLEVRDEEGTLVSSTDSKQIKPEEIPPKIEFFLQTWSIDDIPTLCEFSLQKLQEFAKNIDVNFP